MNKRITDPTVPYIGPIDRGNFYPGKIIRIQGFAPSTAYCFNINLQCGPQTTPQNDVALQVAVHVLDGYISLNSLQDEVWGEEQRGTLPIKRSKKFEVILTCDFNWYKVRIDGEQYYEFPQKIHYHRITHLAIDGDVSIFQISYESASRGGTEGPSETGLGQALQPSAPVALMGNNGDEFETVTSAAEIHPLPFSDSSAPPSYEAALDISKTAPYPTSDPMGMPYPTGAAGGRDFLPYPPAHTSGIHPLAPHRIGIHPPPSDRIGIHPSFHAPVIPPAPRDAPVPLNIGSSNVRPELRSEGASTEARCCIAVVFGVIGIIIFIVKLSTL